MPIINQTLIKDKRRTYFYLIIVVLILMDIIFLLTGKRREDHAENFNQIDTIDVANSRLLMISSGAKLPKRTLDKLAETFLKVYPVVKKRFNPNSSGKITLLLDSSYPGVAGTKGDVIRINSKWLLQHPQDTDVLTHELMHVVQNFSIDAKFSWIKEGMADYIRYKIGLNNLKANWILPTLKASNNYTDSYRVTARFFVWLEHRYGFLLIDHLNRVLFSKGYSPLFWPRETGRTLDQLWSDYTLRELRKGQSSTPYY